MGDLDADTTLRGGDGRFVATVSSDWEIWGPCGGYVAALALRAAGATSKFGRPASFACHYLGIAAFDDVDLEVTALRSGRTTESLRVTMTQAGRPILEALVLAVADEHATSNTHLAHDARTMPAAAAPRSLRSVAELDAERGEEPSQMPFWSNIDSRPLAPHDEWPPPGPLDPCWQQWERFVPTATFDDPWLDAARSVIWVDLSGWPAASLPHAYNQPPWVAVNVDLYVAFHRARPESEFLFVDADSHVAADGLIGYTARTWAEDGTLVASGGGQLLCRPTGVVPNT